ncbi:NAD-dependent epimerase/dehydratase family protein [Carboxylicivirga sp. M1479]|uniref:NAD-dependent epimerase/dehydratase family protein n=1 Tax=Carboxylicivirga sp. M1479 TaxID=2594476 RepID=UPI0011786381|nr:NAD-dependent epimerase/dehydratase family protein [Carboxylicivirga sp. M1479]TRX72622.1 NAD-dependent epimerase/dehydratase family protein [Carboxylicivirga sp. M1479]
MILVTGATGLVGSHLLIELIKNGSFVRALYRSQKTRKGVEELFSYYKVEGFEKIEWLKGDLMDYFLLMDALKDVSVIYHCAAMVSFKPSDRKAMFNVNVEGTANLVNAAIESKTECFCHVSSIATLGKSLNGELIDESSFWQNDDNHSVYSQSKFQSEMEVWRGTKEGLKAVVLNPSVIIGPCADDKSSGQLIHSLSKNMTFYTGGGTGFVDVRNVVDAMIAVAQSGKVNERFIVNGENLSYQTLMQTAAKVFDVKAPTVKANRILTGIAWRLERLKYMLWGQAPKMTKETARTSQNQSKYSADKLHGEMKINMFSIEEALENVKSYKGR